MAKSNGKKRGVRRLVITLVILALLAGGGYYAMRLRESVASQWRTAQVTRGGISVSFSFTGVIRAPNQQTLTAPSDAAVRTVYAPANSDVRRGDRLVRLEDGSLLRAELAGEITQLTVQEGDYVTRGQTLAVITDMHRLEAQISVDEYDVSAIAVGKPVTVRVVALDETCSGTISAFNKQGNTGSQLSSYTATVAIDAPPGALPGMQVEVTLLKAEAADTLLLPKEALQFHSDNTAFVQVMDGENLPVERAVDTGITDGRQVEILSGLKEGDKVYWQGSGGSAVTFPTTREEFLRRRNGTSGGGN